jgi:hypothetical protein
MKRILETCTAICALLWTSNSYADALTLVSNFSANQAGGFSAGEIVAFDPNTDRLFVTSSGLATAGDRTSGVYRVNIFDASNPASPSPIGNVDFTATFGAAVDMFALSSVAVDPLGRFGAAALIPADTTTPANPSTTTVGRVGFFNLATGAVIGAADAGFHPDSVSFSADGSKLVVVNEGEFVPGAASNSAGSISLFDVSGINAGNLATLPTLVATTVDFSGGSLGPGVSLSGIRNANVAAVGTAGVFIGSVPDFTLPANIDPNALEPEYATVSGNKAYVSLQDNNALGEFDLTTNQWTSIRSLGTITQLIDGSDQDGGIDINDLVKGLPMPDTIASYAVGGKTYVVSANEGDARVDDRDISRFGDTGGNDDTDPILDDNYPATQTGVRENSVLGRLNVSRLDGDTDADGKIDDIRMLGTRSFSIWEQTPGGPVLTFDSGSFFEEFIRDNDNLGFVDSRSDDKGPEPEGLTLGVIGDQTFAFIGMERTNGIFMFNVTNPANPFFVDYIRVEDGDDSPRRPEGFHFVSAADSPTGVSLLIVGFEGDGSLTSSERITIFSVVPEPASVMLAIGGLVWLLNLLRRRRAPV